MIWEPLVAQWGDLKTEMYWKKCTIFSLGFNRKTQSWRALGLWFCCTIFLQKICYMRPAGGSGWARISWRNPICVLSVGLEAVWVYRCLCGFVGYRSCVHKQLRVSNNKSMKYGWSVAIIFGVLFIVAAFGRGCFVVIKVVECHIIRHGNKAIFIIECWFYISIFRRLAWTRTKYITLVNSRAFQTADSFRIMMKIISLLIYLFIWVDKCMLFLIMKRLGVNPSLN